MPRGVGVRVPSPAQKKRKTAGIKILSGFFKFYKLLNIRVMNLTKKEIDDLNAQLNIKIEKKDYEENVDKVLKDYKKKAVIDGFRPGKVPFGLIKKRYGLSVLVDEINKLVSKSLSDYLTKTEDKVLGEPLPSENQNDIKWGEQDDYEFFYDIAVAPDFEIKLTKKEKLPYYVVKVEEKDIENQINAYKSRFGKYVDAEEITGEEMIKGDMAQLDDNGEILENGLKVDDVSMLVNLIKDEEQKKLFIGKKAGDTIVFNPKKAFDNDYELAAMLRVQSGDLTDEQKNADYKITINSVNKWVEAEENQELYDNVFGKDAVKTPEEFKEKIIEDIKSAFKPQSEYKFAIDAKEKYVNKVKFDLPLEFLKRWLRATNDKEKLSDEKLEAEMPIFEKDLRWQLIKEKIATDNEIKVEEQDMLDAAKAHVLAQFQQYYGAAINIPDEQVTEYAKEVLKNENEMRHLFERKLEEKVLNTIKEKIKIEEKEINIEEFNKLFQ